MSHGQAWLSSFRYLFDVVVFAFAVLIFDSFFLFFFYHFWFWEEFELKKTLGKGSCMRKTGNYEVAELRGRA